MTKAKIKGATKADKQQIAAARAANAADAPMPEPKANPKSTAAAPEAQATPKEQRAAAQKLFDAADAEGQAQITASNRARGAALGY